MNYGKGAVRPLSMPSTIYTDGRSSILLSELQARTTITASYLTPHATGGFVLSHHLARSDLQRAVPKVIRMLLCMLLCMLLLAVSPKPPAPKPLAALRPSCGECRAVEPRSAGGG